MVRTAHRGSERIRVEWGSDWIRVEWGVIPQVTYNVTLTFYTFKSEIDPKIQDGVHFQGS